MGIKGLILTTCYSKMPSYFKINLILTVLLKVRFLFRKSRAFWVTDKELPIADQEITVPNGIRIERSRDILETSQN